MNEMLQHVVVTVVATGASVVIVRRVLGVFGGGARKAGCDSCSSSKPASAPPTTPIPISSLRSRVRRRTSA